MSLKPDQPETFREREEVSQEELLISTISLNNTAPLLALLFYVPWYPNKHLCLWNVSVKLCTWFSAAVWDFYFFPLLNVFFLDFHAWSGSRTNAQSCEEPTRVNCPSQNTKPIICKTAEFWRKKKKKRIENWEKKVWVTEGRMVEIMSHIMCKCRVVQNGIEPDMG